MRDGHPGSGKGREIAAIGGIGGTVVVFSSVPRPAPRPWRTDRPSPPGLTALVGQFSWAMANAPEMEPSLRPGACGPPDRAASHPSRGAHASVRRYG
jgi:hypothetical protein